MSKIVKDHNLYYHSYADDTHIYIRCENNATDINTALPRVVSDKTETGCDHICAFIYSDNLIIIRQVTPVTIQNKNHLEIIQIRTQIKLVIW